MDFNKLIDEKVVEKRKKDLLLVEKFLKDPFKSVPKIEDAISISEKFGVDLHPNYLFYWNEITSSELILFLEFLKKAEFRNYGKDNFSICLPLNEQKRVFENLGIEHIVEKLEIFEIKSEEYSSLVVLDSLNSKILLVNLGFDFRWDLSLDKFKVGLDKLIKLVESNLSKTSVEILNMVSFIGIRDKGGSYIGARMGRPEKAKMRKQFNDETRSHGLFPVGEGEIISTKRFGSDEEHREVIANRLKNIMIAFKNGYVEEDFRIYYCSKCNAERIYSFCEVCNSKTKQKYFEKYSGVEMGKEEENSVYYRKKKVDIVELEKHLRNVIGSGVEFPKHVKGISSTINKHHTTEHVAKSFLRALNGVFVNKDGTVRYDMIEMGLTHFKPKEIGTSIEKLKELGYTHDYEGNPLVDIDQIIEIFPQDVVLPDCIESGDELASDYIINTGNFVDDLLEKLYKLDRFYNFKTKDDTIGHLVIGLAPHTSAGIVGRIIGYSKTQGCFSHPVWHAAQRRNLDGDENGILLLMDGLINFSRDYLPDRRGSRSVSSDTVLFVEEEGELKCVEIGKFIDDKFKEGYNIEEDGFETLSLENLKVFSFSENLGKVGLEKVSKLIRHVNDKKVFEIKTSDGWIKTTEDHSIFSFDFNSGKIIEKNACELNKGDFILGLSKIDFEERNLKGDVVKVKIKDLGIKYDVRGVQIKDEIEFNEDFFFLLGFIYAEGHIRGNKIEIGNTDKIIIDRLVKIGEDLLGIRFNVIEDKREDKYTNGIYYRINLPSQFVKVLKFFGVKEQRALDKEVPDFVFRTSRNNIESFIDGYLSGDGTSYLEDRQRKSIRLYTASLKLASGLSFLAYLIGKKSTCRKSLEKKRDSQKYEVFISDFKMRSSFWSVYHLRTEINDGLKIAGCSLKERNFLLANICLNARLKTSSKDKIEKIVLFLEKEKDKNKLIIEKLKLILNSDLRLEIVNEVKQVDYSGYVYDLEVPKYQNFLCGPHPIFAHNTMDVSLVLTSHLYLDQIDDEVHGMDIVPFYPLEFYRANKEFKSPKDVKIEKVSKRVEMEGVDEKYLGYKFTHNTDNMNDTVMCSSYKSVPSMTEKLDLQLGLAKKIRSVDENQVGSFVIDKHFMKDIKGNLRKFSMQTFRCTNCGEKYRRPPLIGKCKKCGNNSINFTIHEGSIKKYVEPSFKIVKEYDVDPYLVETLELVNLRIEGVFGKEIEKQKDLSGFFGK